LKILGALMALIIGSSCSAFEMERFTTSTKTATEPTVATTSNSSLSLTVPLNLNTDNEWITYVPVATKPHLKKLKLDEERLILVRNGINNVVAQSFINDLDRLEKANSSKPIYVVLRSPGGSIAAGFRMIAAMKATKPEIVCVVDEGAYSMAAAIFLHCDKKYMQAHSDLMFHEGSLGVEGDKRIVEERLRHYIRQMDELNEDIAKKLDMPLEVYLERVKFEWWLTADQAVEEGIADQAVDGLKYPFETPPPSIFTFFNQKGTHEL